MLLPSRINKSRSWQFFRFSYFSLDNCSSSIIHTLTVSRRNPFFSFQLRIKLNLGRQKQKNGRDVSFTDFICHQLMVCVVFVVVTHLNSLNKIKGIDTRREFYPCFFVRRVHARDYEYLYVCRLTLYSRCLKRYYHQRNLYIT